jgi:hypothetical protein
MKTKIQIIIAMLLASLACQTVVQAVSPSSQLFSGPMVGREPSEWLPTEDEFTLKSFVPFKGDYTITNSQSANGDQDKLITLNESGRIISFGHEWLYDDCSYSEGDMHYVITGAILAKSTESATKLLDYYYQRDQAGNEVTPLEDASIGEEGYFYITNYDSGCALPATEYSIFFKRYNVIGQVLVDANTPPNESTELMDWVTQTAKQLDAAIVNEAAQHPGNKESLESLYTSYFSDATQSKEDTGNPNDFLDDYLTCNGMYGSYEITGYLQNSSSRKIGVYVHWSPADTTAPGYVFSGGSEYVEVLPNERKNISIDGGDVLKAGLILYEECIVTISSTEWVD